MILERSLLNVASIVWRRSKPRTEQNGIQHLGVFRALCIVLLCVIDVSSLIMFFHLAYTLLLVFRSAAVILTNYTIDDQLGDSVTGMAPTYDPEILWVQGNECGPCFAKLDPEQVFDHSK